MTLQVNDKHDKLSDDAKHFVKIKLLVLLSIYISIYFNRNIYIILNCYKNYTQKRIVKNIKVKST